MNVDRVNEPYGYPDHIRYDPFKFALNKASLAHSNINDIGICFFFTKCHQKEKHEI